MSTITRERVAQFINNPLDNGLTRGEQMELARIALASLEAEPIYQLWDMGFYDTDKETYDALASSSACARIVYAAPQLFGNSEHVSNRDELPGWIKCSERMPAGDTISNRTHLSRPERNTHHTLIIRYSYTTEANQSELTTANFCGHIVGTLQNDHGFMPTCLR